MKRLYILPALLLLMLSASACDSNDLFSDGGSDYRVVYTVDVNGESVITSLSYRDRGGALRTVTKPHVALVDEACDRTGRAGFAVCHRNRHQRDVHRAPVCHQ